MNVASYPHAPHLDLAFWFESGEVSDNFSAIAAAVAQTLAAPTGNLDFIDSVDEPCFAEVSTLPVKEVDGAPDSPGSMVRLHEPRWTIREGFFSADIGNVLVQLQRTVDIRPLSEHPLCVRLSGEELEDIDMADIAEARRLRTVADRVRLLFQRLCEESRISYGAILVERDLPTPRDLRAGSGELRPDIFLSSELLSACQAEFESALRPYCHEQWSRGGYWSRTALFNARRIDVPIEQGLPSRLAKLVAKALGD